LFSALRNRDYRLYWSGTLISWIGTHLQAAAQSWYVYAMTGNTYYVGLVGFFGQLPMVLTLLGGVVADRMDKCKICFALRLFIDKFYFLRFCACVAKGIKGGN
jgi:Na+/melibiose symporter-like transporter